MQIILADFGAQEWMPIPYLIKGLLPANLCNCTAEASVDSKVKSVYLIEGQKQALEPAWPAKHGRGAHRRRCRR
jgi:hypothetical protein